MTLDGDTISAVRARLPAIGLSAVVAGVGAFLLGYATTPRYEVLGYVEIARLYQVDAAGSLKDDLVVSAPILAGQINSGAFFETADVAGAGKPVHLRRAKVIARVPVRTENVELTARADSASEGIQLVTGVVQRISAAHQAEQQPTLDRLQRRNATIHAELDELLKARKQLDSLFAARARSGKAGAELQSFLLASLRSQSSREIHELERMRQSTADAIAQMQEHRTRLIGSVIPYPTPLVSSVFFGIAGGLLGALLAVAIVVARAYRRGVRAHD